MHTPPGEPAATPVPNFNDLTVEEFRKRMSQARRTREALHARRCSGRPVSQSQGVRFVVPSEDPFGDIYRKFDAVAAYLVARLGGPPDVPPPTYTVVSQPKEDDADALPWWVAGHLTKQSAKLVRALWGKGDVSPKEIWLTVWRREDPVKRETIESAVKRANRQLEDLPAEVTSTYYVQWHQKRLRLAAVDGQGFKSEPNEPPTVND